MATQILLSAAASSYTQLHAMLNCHPQPKFQSPSQQQPELWKTAASQDPEAAIQGAHPENFLWVKRAIILNDEIKI